MKKRFFSLMLALAMCCSLCVPAFASSSVDKYEDLRHAFDSSYEFDEDHWIYDSNGDLIYLAGDEVDDTPLESLPQPLSLDGTQYLFTMTLSAMYNDIHTTGSKSFTKASLDNDYVRAIGVIESDVNEYVTVGLCYYDDGYEPCNWTLERVNCNEYFTVSWETSDLDSHFYYYGWAQSSYNSNEYPYSGYIEYYDSVQS